MTTKRGLFSATAAAITAVFVSTSALMAAEKQILIVLTNHSALGETGKKTGFFLSEASHPWEVFKKAGYQVKLASPKGGFAPLDMKSHDLKDEANKQFWAEFGSGEEASGNVGIKDTLPLAEAKAEDYKAVFYAGGHGTMWDFRNDASVKAFTARVYEQGGAVGAVCHGPAALVDVKLSDGNPLVKGKKVAGFTNEEEKAVELEKVVPYLLQTELENSGGKFVAGEKFKENAVCDGKLVTGQNPASAKKTAELLVEALGEG